MLFSLPEIWLFGIVESQFSGVAPVWGQVSRKEDSGIIGAKAPNGTQKH